MSKFGIFLAYPPTTELRGEGLSRHLAQLLKGAAQRGDVRIVVACPTWTVDGLEALCEDEQVPPDSFELLTMRALPISLRAQAFARSVVDAYARARRRPRGTRTRGIAERLWRPIERFFVSTRNLLAFAVAGMLLAPLVVAAVVLSTTSRATTVRVHRLVHRSIEYVRRRVPGTTLRARLATLIRDPAAEPWGRHLYRSLEAAEADALVELVNARDDVVAWYCPTAFWPQFNRIARPRVMCVPDLVLSRVPVSFAETTGRLGQLIFRRMSSAIEAAPHFVTYSEDVKWETLVRQFDRAPDTITVIRHGNSDLAGQIRVDGTPDPESASLEFCRGLLADALMRATNLEYALSFQNREFRFIFCPNQARPNKNMLTLVQAYEDLLRRRGLSHKLVLTGDAMALESVREYATRRRLENDVLCLRRLTVQQLAACYRLSDVAVNPSLFEGGCPFTLTEALSVGTPAVMARIAVTEEVIVDALLQDVMLFDPYDAQDAATRIGWAIEHRDELLALQRKVCAPLLARTWADVSNEYLNLLEQVAASAGGARRFGDRPDAISGAPSSDAPAREAVQ